MNLMKLECASCGSKLDVDLDRLLSFCPYCGQKLMFDVSHIEEILAEKEKTRQEQEKTKQEEEKTKQIQYEKEQERITKRTKYIVTGWVICTPFIIFFLMIVIVSVRQALHI